MERGAIIATITLVLVLVIWTISLLLALRKSESREPNYRVFFITGLILVAIGIIWIGASFFLDITIAGGAFLGLGVIYLIICLANRDKWRKKKEPESEAGQGTLKGF